MIMMNYYVQIDKDNYIIMEGDVQLLEQNLYWQESLVQP
jgi:hypothetical protein